MAINRISPKKGKVVDIPANAPTIGTPTAGAAQVSVAFTAPSATVGGPIQKYQAISNPGSISAIGTTSPIVVTGLTNDTAYTFTVAAGNSTGYGPYSSASASATPVDPAGFVSIATTTVGAGGSSTITFSSIPSTYKHLQLRMIGRSSRSQNSGYAVVSYNSDTGTNYSYHALAGDGATASADAYSTVNYQTLIYFPGALRSANIFGVGVLDILDYTNTNKYKTLRVLDGYDSNGAGLIALQSGSWRNTNAVTSITITEYNGNNFEQYSSFALYGIKG